MDMQQANWVWSTTGDLTVNGSSIEAQGAPSSTFSGDVVLDLPKDAVPKRHLFTQTDGVDLDATFNISLQVLQVYRSNISLIEPTPPTSGTPVSLNVSEPHRFLMFLSNPGNGEDTFELQPQHPRLRRAPPTRLTSPSLTRKNARRPRHQHRYGGRGSLL